MTDHDEGQTGGQKPWIKPAIVPLRSGLLNKFGGRLEAAWMDTIDDVPVADLLEQYGSCLLYTSDAADE